MDSLKKFMEHEHYDSTRKENVLTLALGGAPNPERGYREQLTSILGVEKNTGDRGHVIVAIDELYGDKEILKMMIQKLNEFLKSRFGESAEAELFDDKDPNYLFYQLSYEPGGGDIADVLFLPMRIPSDYFQDLDEDERIDKLPEFGSIDALADHCKPADKEPWNTFRKLFAAPEVAEIRVHNGAWYRTGAGRFTNLSMEGMCELLYLLKESGKWKSVLLEADPMNPDSDGKYRIRRPAALFRPFPKVVYQLPPNNGSARRRRRTMRRVLKNPKTLKKRIR